MTAITVCLSHCGVLLYVDLNNCQIGVNIKTYIKSTVTNNPVYFDFPEEARNDNGSVTLAVEDDGEQISVYVGDSLVCFMCFSEPTKRYRALSINDYCFNSAQLYDNCGNLMGEYSATLVMADGSIIGWATRCAEMKLDNICLAVASEDDASTDDGIDVDSLPDNCPGRKPETEAALKNRLYPWLTATTETVSYDFTATDVKTYSADKKLSTAGLRTGMKFADGALSCKAKKTFSFGSSAFLGDGYGIIGGTFGFDMDLTAGTVRPVYGLRFLPPQMQSGVSGLPSTTVN